MNQIAREKADQVASAFEESGSISGNPGQDEKRFSDVGRYDVIGVDTDKENFHESSNQHRTTMDSISSFLETMHSKNLTLKKLAKVQQHRIDELTGENSALRQALEMKEEEIRKTQTQLDMLRDLTSEADLSEIESLPIGHGGTSKIGMSSHVKPSDTSNNSVVSNTNTRPTKKSSTGERRKTSIIVSHKVAVKRMIHIMRKINGACNRRSVGLYTFAYCFAQAALPQLLGFSSETSPILCIPPL